MLTVHTYIPATKRGLWVDSITLSRLDSILPSPKQDFVIRKQPCEDILQAHVLQVHWSYVWIWGEKNLFNSLSHNSWRWSGGNESCWQPQAWHPEIWHLCFLWWAGKVSRMFSSRFLRWVLLFRYNRRTSKLGWQQKGGAEGKSAPL